MESPETSDYTGLDIIIFVMLSVKIRDLASHYRFIEITPLKSGLSKPVLSWHFQPILIVTNFKDIFWLCQEFLIKILMLSLLSGVG